MRRSHLIFVTILAVLAGSTVFSKTPRQKHCEERLKGQEVVIRPIYWNLGASFFTGCLVGSWADSFDKTSDKMLYGFALNVDLYPKTRYALGAELALAWKVVPNVRGSTVGGTFTYNLTGLRRHNPYFRLLVGTTAVWVPDYDEHIGRDYGMHLTIGATLGLLSYTRGKSNYRIELYYQRISGDDHYAAAEFLGLRLGLGIPIFRKQPVTGPTDPFSL